MAANKRRDTSNVLYDFLMKFTKQLWIPAEKWFRLFKYVTLSFTVDVDTGEIPEICNIFARFF
jgi:hypothetical protein